MIDSKKRETNRGNSIGFGFLFTGLLIVMGITAITLAMNAGSSLLWILTFWTTLAEGSVALVAAAELSNALWIQPVKLKLLKSYYLIPVLGVLFLVFGIANIDIYPWSQEHNGWLNIKFFMIRNLFLFVFAFAAARKFARASMAESNQKKLYAVIYLLTFVWAQTILAFDWIMSLEYPWYSTLFGGFFFIEAVYVGIAMTVLLSGALITDGDSAKKTMRDAATLMFGFSLFWAGLFYAQFLVIWYGDLPEEASFVFKRIYAYPYSFLAKGILAALFIIPFATLLSRKVKTRREVLYPLASLVMMGSLAEKFLFINPVARINAIAGLLDFLLMTTLYLTLISGSKLFTR